MAPLKALLCQHIPYRHMPFSSITDLPKYSAHTFCFSFSLTEVPHDTSCSPCFGACPTPWPQPGCCCLHRYLSHQEKPHTTPTGGKKSTEETFQMIDISPPLFPLLYHSPFFPSLHLLAQTNEWGYIPPPTPNPSHRGKRALQGFEGGKMRV